MGERLLSSAGLQFGTLIGRASSQHLHWTTIGLAIVQERKGQRRTEQETNYSPNGCTQQGSNNMMIVLVVQQVKPKKQLSNNVQEAFDK